MFVLMSDSIRNNRLAAAAIFVFFFSLYAYCMQGVRLGADELGMYLVTESLAAEGDVYLDPAWGARVVLVPCGAGRACARFGIGQSLAQLPLYLIGRIFIKEESSPEVFGPGRNLYLFTSLTGPLLGAAACVLLFLFCLRLGWRTRAAVYLTALFGLGTLTWPFSGLLFSEILQMFSLLACIYLILTYSQRGGIARAAAAGFFFGLAAAAKFMLVLVLPIVLGYAYLLLRDKDSKKQPVFYAGFLPLFAAWMGVTLWYNAARFGSAFEFGYYLLDDRDALFRFSVPLWSGLHGLLLSPGKGLFWYVPCAAGACAALGAFARRRPAEAFLCAGLPVVLILSYARWNQWHGDYAWGPRFLVPLMPFLVLPLGAWLHAPSKRPVLRAAVLAALLAGSVFVQFLGVSVKTGAYLSIAKSQPPFEVLYMPGDIRLRDDLLNQHFIPDFSPLAAHAWILKHTVVNRGLTGDKLNEAMRRDFPWKSLIHNGAPADPAVCVGWNFWHAYFKEYVPGAARWVTPASAAALLMCLAAACVILLGVVGNYKKSSKE